MYIYVKQVQPRNKTGRDSSDLTFRGRWLSQREQNSVWIFLNSGISSVLGPKGFPISFNHPGEQGNNVTTVTRI